MPSHDAGAANLQGMGVLRAKLFAWFAKCDGIYMLKKLPRRCACGNRLDRLCHVCRRIFKSGQPFNYHQGRWCAR